MYDVDFGNLPDNANVYESYVVCDDKLNRDYRDKNIMISISGGADSDIILDLTTKTRKQSKEKMHYVFFDTGIEYAATKQHFKRLEEKYNIKIEVEKAKTPVPLGCKKYGLPFLSKQVSEYIERLQAHNFKWENEDFETLLKKYPKCKVALRWWCNKWGDKSKFNIGYNKYLKEFMIENPPTFKISNKCCKGAKKDVAKEYKKAHEIDLSIVGVRKAEGGARSSIPSCFTEYDDACDEYRPIFWYKGSDKADYETFFNIEHSACYTEYGFKRTGCAGCPFGRDFEKELQIIEKYEPRLYNAVNAIFKESYDYTRKYKEFVKQKESE